MSGDAAGENEASEGQEDGNGAAAEEDNEYAEENGDIESASLH